MESRLLPSATITVNTTADQDVRDGTISLREAIEIANGGLSTSALSSAEQAQVSGDPADSLADRIVFSIPGGGPQTIMLVAVLPEITAPMIIDGTTQPGYAGVPVIELNGSGAGPGADGLRITAGASALLGLVINRFDGSGIALSTTSGDAAAGHFQGNNFIEGNYIGLDLAGDGDVGNLRDGIHIDESPGNFIGGNVISRNRNNGIVIAGRDSRNNIVQGNAIGTDPAGTRRAGNSICGVLIDDAGFNQIGVGTGSGLPNVISANAADGIRIEGGHAIANQIGGNMIGTDVTGTVLLGNLQDGVRILIGASSNRVGGNSRAQRNIISGNGDNGVELSTSATDNTIEGNSIGMDATGLRRIGNISNGVLISDTSRNLIGGAGIPGTSSFASGNVISGNGRNGVLLSGSMSTGNTVAGNLIGLDATGHRGGLGVGNSENGVFVSDAPGNVIGGTSPEFRNVVSGNLGDGIQIFSRNAKGNRVVGNLIGTDIDGRSGKGNSFDGVLISLAPGNTIGGPDARSRNIISSNGGAGVEISGFLSSRNVVQGNFIGTDPAGSRKMGNARSGVLINFALNNVIGGAATASGRNVISGNDESGIEIFNTASTGNLVRGNLIGTDSSGTRSLGNARDGVLISNAPGNLVGGTTPQARNVISGNDQAGVEILGPSVKRELLIGNYLGTDISGRAAVPNGVGVLINGTTGTTIGGAAPGAGNLISGNLVAGIQITGLGAKANVIRGNTIGLDASGRAPLGNEIGVFLNNVAGDLIGDPATGDRNVISGNRTAGVYILGGDAQSNLVKGDFIGPDRTGTRVITAAAFGSQLVQRVGVLVNGAIKNVVGGTAAGAGNLISGNQVGVELAGFDASLPQATDNRVLGNLIGTNVTGQVPLANVVGIYVNGLPGNLIGASGAGNVISGNTSVGVFLYGNLATGNKVLGNTIGLGRDGKAMFRHKDTTNTLAFDQTIGVGIQDASNNTVGMAGAGNVITGNDQAGVYILGHSGSAQDNVIQANLIGLDRGARGGPGNRLYGVLLYNAPGNTVVQSGSAANRFGANGIANLREFSGAQSAGNTVAAARSPARRPVRRTP